MERGIGSRTNFTRILFEIALFNGVDQGARCRFGRNAKIVAQQVGEQLYPAQRGLASLVARKQLQRGTLTIFARRLQCSQPFSRRDGALAIAICIGLPTKRGEYARRHRCKPVSLLTMPGIELFDIQSEFRQKRSVPKLRSLGECVRPVRSSE